VPDAVQRECVPARDLSEYGSYPGFALCAISAKPNAGYDEQGVLMASRNLLNGGQLIVDYLVREGVPYVFGLCGHGNIGLLDALYERKPDITTISVHHETVAGFMADVYYRVAGRPVATFTSCGPGSANLPIALANAFLDSVPFLAITGNVPTSQFNRGAFQELYRHYQADYPSTVRAYCKRVFQPTRGDMVALTVRQAWKTMVTGRPGPVVLDVPFDIFKEAAAEETPNPKEWNANISSRCGADPDGVSKAVDMLIEAERPVILVGQGVRYGGAGADLLALAERLQIPVAASASGLGAIPSEHPLALGLVSRGGLYHANHAARQADVLLALGVRFDDRTSSSWLPGYSFTIPPTKLIHVDIDPDEIARNYPVTLGLMADVRTFLRQLLGEIERRKDINERAAARKKWLAAIEGYRREWNALVEPGFKDDATPINPQRAAHEIDRALPEDAILVSDIGVHHNWLLQFCKPKRPDSLIGSMGFGPMGFGVAGVLGAKLAAPERPCVGVVGDGAFFMHASVLGTAIEYDLPVVWIIWNNFAYASIRGLQRGYLGGRELATDFKHPRTGAPYNPDFATMARSAGVEGVTVERPGDLADAVRAAIASGKPYLIDAMIAADKNPGGAGVWELPGHGLSAPVIGGRHQPGTEE
jgi:acetolactate synthase I/II/III large subunit